MYIVVFKGTLHCCVISGRPSPPSREDRVHASVLTGKKIAWTVFTSATASNIICSMFLFIFQTWRRQHLDGLVRVPSAVDRCCCCRCRKRVCLWRCACACPFASRLFNYSIVPSRRRRRRCIANSSSNPPTGERISSCVFFYLFSY